MDLVTESFTLMAGNGKVPSFAMLYRRLTPGRWVVTVTGNGSLGLELADSDPRGSDLVVAPVVADFELVDQELQARVRDVGWGEALTALWRGWRKDGAD